MTIGNGVDIDKFSPVFRERFRSEVRDEFDISYDSFVLTIVARLSKIKGYVELFKAIDLISDNLEEDFYLLAVGDVVEDEPYPLRKEDLLNIISDKNLRKRIIFTGMRNDVNKILAGTDVFVLPSFLEGMPRSIIEAMAMGLPVITSNIKGCREEVINNETGILIPPGDVEALASAILKLYKERELRERMGINGRKRVEELYDERKVIEKELLIIDKLSSEAGSIRK
jgi:glycosyltransferase involved in cell wall biosynthesis